MKTATDNIAERRGCGTRGSGSQSLLNRRNWSGFKQFQAGNIPMNTARNTPHHLPKVDFDSEVDSGFKVMIAASGVGEQAKTQILSDLTHSGEMNVYSIVANLRRRSCQICGTM